MLKQIGIILETIGILICLFELFNSQNWKIYILGIIIAGIGFFLFLFTKKKKNEDFKEIKDLEEINDLELDNSCSKY